MLWAKFEFSQVDNLWANELYWLSVQRLWKGNDVIAIIKCLIGCCIYNRLDIKLGFQGHENDNWTKWNPNIFGSEKKTYHRCLRHRCDQANDISVPTGGVKILANWKVHTMYKVSSSNESPMFLKKPYILTFICSIPFLDINVLDIWDVKYFVSVSILCLLPSIWQDEFIQWDSGSFSND